MMIPATQLRSGMLIVHNGELHRVHDMVHKTPGNLRGFVQARMRNVRTGSMNEHRFGSTDRVEKASLDEREMEYLYSDAAGHHFMDQTSYDQVTLSDEVIGEQMKYLLPNTVIHVDFYEVAHGRKFRIEVPLKLRGKAAGIELGGILEQVVRSLEVECTPDSVPEFVELNVSHLGIGQSLHLGNVVFPAGVQPVEKDMKMTIASVHTPKVEEVVTVAPEEGAEVAVEGASVAEPAEKEKA